MSKLCWSILFLFVASFELFSQTITVSGKVIDKSTGKPIERALISAKRLKDNRIVAFTQTAKDGSFELKKDIQPDSLNLTFSCLGYASQTHRILPKNLPLHIELVSKNFELKEVVVSPQKIMQRGDTITYLVSSFSAKEDRTIGDVLKKIPGIEVLNTGEIKYQGQSLNKFYIEGSDLLGGRYGLATNNVSYKDVASVEIMENHQPVKALQDVVFSGSPALNLKLKEDAKSRWAGTLKAGAGSPELWTGEAFAMRFKPKAQSLNTYKGNNAGNESLEMNVFTSINDFVPIVNNQSPSYIQVTPSSANDIGSSRSCFNQTNNLTSNNLVKVGKDFDLVTEFTGSLDRRESEYTSQTTYFLGGNQTLVEDKTENARELKKALTGKLQLKSNQKKYYLNNDFKLSYDRRDPSIDIRGSYPNTQKASIENWKINNDFDILRRVGDTFFTFRSNNEYASKPQYLMVTKNNLSSVSENIGLSSFYSSNSLDYTIKIGKIWIQAPIRLLYQFKSIENELDTITNGLNTHKLKIDITPSFQYNLNDFHFSLSGALFYQTLFIDHQAHQFYGANPSFSINWVASSRLKLSTSASYSKNLPDESLFYHGNILNNYQNQTAGYIDFSTGKSANFSLSADYKDVIKTLFASFGILLAKRQNTKIAGQDFAGDNILNYYYPGNSNTTMLSVSGSLSKGIDFINGIVSIYPGFIHNQSSIMRNGIAIPHTSDTYSFKGRINSKINNICNLTYEFSYAYNKYQMESNQPYFSSNRLFESLKASFSLAKALQLSYTLEHYCNELTANNYKNFILSDVSASYLPGNRWELSCGVRNMLNEKRYSYFIGNDLNTIYKSYRIRPRNILLSATYRF
jgi:hypothetical protein